MIRNTINQSISLPVDTRKILVKEAKKRKITISAVIIAAFNLWMEKQLNSGNQ